MELLSTSLISLEPEPLGSFCFFFIIIILALPLIGGQPSLNEFELYKKTTFVLFLQRHFSLIHPFVSVVSFIYKIIEFQMLFQQWHLMNFDKILETFEFFICMFSKFFLPNRA